MTRGPGQSPRTLLVVEALKSCADKDNGVPHGTYSDLARRFGLTRQRIKAIAERAGYSQQGAA